MFEIIEENIVVTAEELIDFTTENTSDATKIAFMNLLNGSIKKATIQTPDGETLTIVAQTVEAN